MKHSHARAGYLAAGLASALTLAGAAAVQAQSAGHPTAGAVSSAKAGVSAHASRFGFGQGQGLTARTTYHDGSGYTIRFDRTYRGLPVVRGDFIVHLDSAGQYRYGEGLRISGLPAKLAPSIS